jgi:cell division protein FtsA
MRFWDFWKKEKVDYFLALDIGTEFVKCLVVKVAGNKAKVISYGRQRQGLGEMAGGVVTDISGVIRNCGYAIARAVRNAKIPPPNLAIIGIAGERVKGLTHTIHLSRRHPKLRITKKELFDLVKKVQWHIYDEVRKQLAQETGCPEVEVRLVNSALVDIVVDGQRLQNPIGFQGKEISVSLFNSFAPLVCVGALQTIADELGLSLISIATEPYAVARSYALDDPTDFSGIFIDIGGGTTDVALMRNGGVVGTKMFALGGRAFSKRISRMFDLPFAGAEELKIAHSKGELGKFKEKKIHEAMLEDAKIWLSALTLTLAEFPGSEILPNRIYLCGGGSALPEIYEVLSTDWWKGLKFIREPQVKKINPKDIAGVCDEVGLINQEDVTPLCLASLGFSLISEKRSVAKTIVKLVEDETD